MNTVLEVKNRMDVWVWNSCEFIGHVLLSDPWLTGSYAPPSAQHHERIIPHIAGPREKSKFKVQFLLNPQCFHTILKSVFIPIPKKGNAKECSNDHKIALISHTSKVMIKILQARLQQFVNCELPDVQAVLEKAEEPEIKLPTSARSSKKAREFQKNIYFCFTEYAKAFDCVDHNKLRKILPEMGIPDHLTCLLRNLYAGQEATVRTGRGTTDWFQIGKGVRQGYM